MTKSPTLDKLYSDRDFLEHALATASNEDYESISEKLEAVNARIEQELLANPSLAHDVYEKTGGDPEDPYDVYDYPVIIACRKCRRVLAVDEELKAPETYGVCTPIPEGTKVTKLVM